VAKDPNSNQPDRSSRSMEKEIDDMLMGEPTSQPDLGAEGEIEMARNDLMEARDKMMRAQAELDNYRKRARRELDDERKYAELGLLRDLLPVLDNIHRAIDAAEKKADAGALLAGFKLVRQQLETLLEQHQCRRIEAIGQPFDPAQHNAVMQQIVPDKPESTVVGEMETGFHLHDRVVRPAQVVVSKKE
jgi:molecular chaperone GrpE